MLRESSQTWWRKKPDIVLRDRQTDTDSLNLASLASCRTTTQLQSVVAYYVSAGENTQSAFSKAASLDNEDVCVVKGFLNPRDCFWGIDKMGESCLWVSAESWAIQQWRSCDELLLLCPLKLRAPSHHHLRLNTCLGPMSVTCTIYRVMS